MGIVTMLNWEQWWRRIEGLLLVTVGFAIIYFVFGGDYWTILNPKFKWLTAVTGYTLEFTGLALCVKANKPAPSRVFVLILMLAILLYINIAPKASQPANPVAAGSVAGQMNLRFSRVEKNGTEYIKINLGELFDIAEVGTEEAQQQHYMVRGEVQSNSHLAEQGEFLLLRTAVTCCLADAVTVGFRIRETEKTDWQPGQWANVYGRLVPAPVSQEELSPYLQKLNSVFFTNIHSRYILEAELIELIETPKIPLMFQFKTVEPFSY
jgi:uncharacterized repeat protein (TIGR03943 family)